MKSIAIKDRILVDDEDYQAVSEKTWHLLHCHKSQRAQSVQHTYRDKSGKAHNISLHRFLMTPPKGMVVDHINGNVLDNRRQNLRITDYSNNIHNRQNVVKGKSGFIGVSILPPSIATKNSMSKKKKQFYATITKDGVAHPLGTFHTAEEAARARDKKAFELYGEHAYLNFPEEHKA